jgi:exopolysaccharide biosynthesis polyprenyl glycosylphosphotransferase
VDILTSFIGLILATPILVAATIAIKLDSRGGIFFKQPRVGQDGKTFSIYKLRTMKVDAEKYSGPVWAKKSDDRITRVGRFLRATRIDEIPQMWNVLKGDMSFVGPRPERPVFVEQLSEKIPFYSERHRVKPGLTGWAQLCFAYADNEEDTREKLRYDLYYIKNQSLLLDLLIIIQTVEVVLFKKGSR